MKSVCSIKTHSIPLSAKSFAPNLHWRQCQQMALVILKRNAKQNQLKLWSPSDCFDSISSVCVWLYQDGIQRRLIIKTFYYRIWPHTIQVQRMGKISNDWQQFVQTKLKQKKRTMKQLNCELSHFVRHLFWYNFHDTTKTIKLRDIFRGIKRCDEAQLGDGNEFAENNTCCKETIDKYYAFRSWKRLHKAHLMGLFEPLNWHWNGTLRIHDPHRTNPMWLELKIICNFEPKKMCDDVQCLRSQNSLYHV